MFSLEATIIEETTEMLLKTLLNGAFRVSVEIFLLLT